MSLNHLVSQLIENKTLNPRFNSLVVDNSIDLKGSNINNVGNINSIPISNINNSSFVSYDDTKVPPPLGSSNVQGAIDALKGGVSSSPDYILISDVSNSLIIPNSSNTTINTWSLDTSNGGIALNTNTSVLISKSGIYILTYDIQFQTASNGQRNINVLVNGSQIQRGRITVNSDVAQVVGPNLCGSCQLVLSSGDNVAIQLFQSSGGSINLFAGYLEMCQLN